MTAFSRSWLRVLVVVCVWLCCAPAWSAANPRVRFNTSSGSFTVELDAERAPLTTKHFLERVRSGHYSGTIFHRVVAGFIAQGGGYDTKYAEKAPGPNVVNESGNGLSNARGTIGLARGADPHGGNDQFYLNLADNGALDPQPSRWGYAVFGRVVDGMTTVDEIGNVATGEAGPLKEYAPRKQIVIESIDILP
ncbi:MAG TPA: peptidylprolyl isomerase [Steroidobacteraceae bacterium]|nr:peptidylprolyl isomerase [Steroidobacteraceae bacterium]